MIATLIERGLYLFSSIAWFALANTTTKTTLAAALMLTTFAIVVTISRRVI